ncbi:hypothetical protein DXG03_000386 [Asterophora parasitica]|uniref:PNPLA domain-containing protein n=1 Tax=Asterophora parasitica TaxID=117018 RepID=A0A9P7GED1_9AGAR|nr:hypothetical protein DXG03_000386 [Asterophora parasitica]
MSTPDPLNGSRRYKLTTEALLSADYVEESHIQAFADALGADELFFDHNDASSPNIPGTPASPVSAPATRVRKVSALSDFAPVNLKVKRRNRKKDRSSHGKRSDWLFLLLRWPLLFFIFLFIAGEFGFYIVIRQLVNTKEWITAWRGKKGVLRKKLRASKNYQEWKENALTLDEFLHFHEWKQVDEDPFYDWKLVKKMREDVLGFWKHAFALISLEWNHQAYFDELGTALEFIRETPELSIDEKKRFFKSANTNLDHVGVVKAFLDADLLPRVVTGTSAGGLIAALVCTRTDEELKLLLVPELANRITACEEPSRVWMERVWKTGARFDSVL